MKTGVVRNRLHWLVWVLGAAAFHLFGNNAGSLTILLASLLIPVLSMVPLVFAARQIQLKMEAPPEGRPGTAIGGVLTVRPGGFFPFACMTCQMHCENLLTGERFELKLPIRRRFTRFSVSAAHCGVIRLAVPELIVSDGFGLFARRILTDAEGRVMIVPDYFSVDVRLADQTGVPDDGDAYSLAKPGFDSSETFGYRAYVPGDSIRSIHWKLSVKTGEMMVREYGLPVSDQVLLLFCAPPPGGVCLSAAEIHAMAEAFLSVSHSLSARDIPHTLQWTESPDGGAIRHEVTSEEDTDAAMPMLLSNPVRCSAVSEPGPSIGGFAHIVAVGACNPAALSGLLEGSRVTLLTPEDCARREWTLLEI